MLCDVNHLIDVKLQVKPDTKCDTKVLFSVPIAGSRRSAVSKLHVM